MCQKGLLERYRENTPPPWAHDLQRELQKEVPSTCCSPARTALWLPLYEWCRSNRCTGRGLPHAPAHPIVQSLHPWHSSAVALIDL